MAYNIIYIYACILFLFVCWVPVGKYIIKNISKTKQTTNQAKRII